MAGLRRAGLRRAGEHLALAGRLGWPAAAIAVAGGGVLAASLPVSGAWLVLLIAAVVLPAGLALGVVAGARAGASLAPRAEAHPATVLESATTLDQVAHVLLRAGLVLAGFYLGLQAIALLGLGRA